MGHLMLLAVCPKAPQSLHLTCGQRKGRVSQQKAQAALKVPSKDRQGSLKTDWVEETEKQVALYVEGISRSEAPANSQCWRETLG